MGAPPGWGPGSKEREARRQESYEFQRKRDAEEKRRAEEREIKRGYDLFRNGDLVTYTGPGPHNGKVGVIVQNGYRRYFEIFTDGQAYKWQRENVEVLSEAEGKKRK